MSPSITVDEEMVCWWW